MSFTCATVCPALGFRTLNDKRIVVPMCARESQKSWKKFLSANDGRQSSRAKKNVQEIKDRFVPEKSAHRKKPSERALEMVPVLRFYSNLYPHKSESIKTIHNLPDSPQPPSGSSGVAGQGVRGQIDSIQFPLRDSHHPPSFNDLTQICFIRREKEY